jgi:hypothetical protein
MGASAAERIPREQWQDVCQRFARSHRGWLTRLFAVRTDDLELGGPNDSGREIGQELPLQDVIMSEAGPEPQMLILTGADDRRISYPIIRPRALLIEHDAEGSEAGLRVDDAAGHSTILRFRVAAPPETLDGLTPGEL